MNKETKDAIQHVLSLLSNIDYIRPEDLPNIALYMDQVTTFMDEQLSSTKRHEDDKILTKTMINNYAKNKLLPPPDKKKYSREHLLMLLFIYYFKNILSIGDIQKLMGPITDHYFQSGKEQDMNYIYKEIFQSIHGQASYLERDLLRRVNAAETLFSDAPEEDQEFLHNFSFICLLSFDVYMKKMIIEQMIDQMNPEIDPQKAKKEKKAKKQENE